MRKILALVALAALAACGGDSTGPSAGLNGTYALKTVNGLTVPAVLYQDASEKYEITAGSLTINGSNYTVSISDRDTYNGTVTTSVSTDAGTVAVNGSTVTFTSSNPAPGDTPTTATFSGGNTITATDVGSSMVFQK